MNTWTYDLTTEADPLVRLGIHGLWRHLTFGADQPSDTVSWDLTDTTVTVRWTTPADLNRLMSRMVGDLADGIAVPPGYPTDRTDQGIYATVLAHKGITQHFFAKKGAARTRSESVSDKVDPSEAPWSTEDKIARLELKFTRHRLHDSTPTMDVTGKGALREKQDMGVVYHPMVSQWNHAAVVVDPRTKLALAFACLAHVYTQDAESGEPFGLGIDAPTFTAADDLHLRWIDSPLFRAPNETVCAWGIASLLDLPPGTYVQVGVRGSSLVTITGPEVRDLYPILRSGMGEHEGVRAIRLLSGAEIQRAYSGRDAYDQIVRNVRLGRAWYTDVIPVNPHPSIRKTLTAIHAHEASPMEQQIAHSMSRIRAALAARYRSRYGLSPNAAYDRADGFIVNVHLNRARNRPALLRAVANITREARRGFTAEEMGWILDRSEKRHAEVQSLLILACTTFYGKKAESDQGVATPVDVEAAPEDDSINFGNLLGMGT
jgi:hypothetical protein